MEATPLKQNSQVDEYKIYLMKVVEGWEWIANHMRAGLGTRPQLEQSQ